MLQFITNSESKISVPAQVASALKGGCRWIQLNMAQADDEEIRHVVKEVKPMCDRDEAFLLLTDKVDLAKELEVSGVHLSKESFSPTQARIILGAGAVIGITVNSFEEVLKVAQTDIDYLSIGPYGDENAEPEISPDLGLDGLREICRRMEEDEITIARVAIGGITLTDIEDIMRTGVNGVAISDCIADSPDPVMSTREIIDMLPKN